MEKTREQRNNVNSVSSNYCSIDNTSNSKYKCSASTKWNNKEGKTGKRDVFKQYCER